MAVYFELVTEDLDQRFRKSLDNRSRAGVKNVRRPDRGIEVKEDTYAVFRVVRADGSEIKLVDSSWAEGEGRGYANFLLQSVQDARMERQQIIETFSSPLVFFFGESPRFIDVSALLLNTNDFNWEAEWWENYNKYLRGTQLVESGARAYLHYDDTIIEGYPLNATAVKSADTPYIVQLQFRMFVTNYANVSAIGDPYFPIHESAVLPANLNERDDRTFAFEVQGGPQVAAQTLFIRYLKQLGAVQIQEEIAKVQSIEEAQRLQKQYALDQLGVGMEGQNLIPLAKSFFQGAVGAVRGDNETVDQANQRFREEAKKALHLSQQGDPIGAAKLLASGHPIDALNAVSNRGGGVDPPSLTDALRNAILYSTPYVGQDLSTFVESAQKIVFPGGARQILEPKRTFPLRSRIVDNYDEYRGTLPEQAAAIFEERTGVRVGGEVDDLPSTVANAMESLGVEPTAENMYKTGLVSWRPGEGVRVNKSDPFGRDPLTDPSVPGAGSRYTYSKQWGTTPQAGGSSGGALGGGFGPGYGGKAQDQGDLFGTQGVSPYGSPFGGQESTSPYSVTGGKGPDGEPLYKFKYTYGPTPGGSFFSGSGSVGALNAQDDTVQGKGAFGVHTAAGTLKE